MKTSILTTMLFLTAFASAQLTGEARLLKEKRDAKIAEINRIFKAELEKIKLKELKANNADAALAIAKELGDETSTPSEALKNRIVNTKWKNSTNSWIITFRKDGKMKKSWGDLTPDWEVKDDTVISEGTTFVIGQNESQMIATGGKKDGIWLKMK